MYSCIEMRGRNLRSRLILLFSGICRQSPRFRDLIAFDLAIELKMKRLTPESRKGYISPWGQEEIGIRTGMHTTPVGRTRQKRGEKYGLKPDHFLRTFWPV